MAKVLIVVYELHKEPTSEDYKELVKIIREYDHLKIGGSEYCIYTTDSPSTVTEKLKPYFEKGEKLLVIKVTDPKQGLLKKDEWAWLKERL